MSQPPLSTAWGRWPNSCFRLPLGLPVVRQLLVNEVSVWSIWVKQIKPHVGIGTRNCGCECLCKWFEILEAVNWRGSDYGTSKYAALEYWLFWAEGTWETVDLWPSPFYLKQVIRFPMRKVPLLCQEKKNILITGDWELMPKWPCTNKLTKITRIFH